jgi:hypothetical protein
VSVLRVIAAVLAGATALLPVPTPAASAEDDGSSAAQVALDRALAAQAGRGVLSAPPLTTASLRRILARAYGERTAVLVYRFKGQRLDDPGLEAWLVDEAGIRASGECRRTPRQIAADLGALQSGLGVRLRSAARSGAPDGPGDGAADPARATSAAAALARCLFPQEVASALQGVEQLAILPTRFLGIVPFALLRPGAEGPLIDRLTLTVLPSVHALAPLADATPWVRTPRAVVVGDPRPSGPRYQGLRFEALPGARAEAIAVARALRSEPYLGERAALGHARSEMLDADLIYLSTHGFVFPPGMFGYRGAADFVALTDGPWTATEVAMTPLTARLAVLSACETALGKPEDAGVTGMARAFHQAGVARVVVSLWKVDDAATADLMTRFVEAFPAPPEAALRTAMRSLRRERPEPSAWAPFVVYGAPTVRPEVFRKAEAEPPQSLCADGACLVAFVPDEGRPRMVCAGAARCAEAYREFQGTREGWVWIARVEDRAMSAWAAQRSGSDLGAAQLTLAVLEAGGGARPGLWGRRVVAAQKEAR